MRLKLMTAIGLLWLLMSCSSCARLCILPESDRIYIVPKNIVVQTMQGQITTERDMVMMDKGKYLHDVMNIDKESLK